MKKMLISLLLTTAMLFSTATMAVAAEPQQKSGEDGVNYSVDFGDTMLDTATKISEETIKENCRISTETTYLLEDGTTVVDIFTRGDNAVTRSANGSDTATRTRVDKNWGSISLTASFSWRTEGAFSYIKCTGASASKAGLHSNTFVKTWYLTKTTNEVSVGSANATLKYAFYDKTAPVFGTDGTLKITCSDSGTISDNA